MSILSILAFTAIKTSRKDHASAFVGNCPATFRRDQARFELIKVGVASEDALQVRKALLSCADMAIVRCMPMQKDDKVELEIRFPAGQGDTVIDRILAAVPNGEIGGIAACATPLPRSRASQASMGQLYGF